MSHLSISSLSDHPHSDTTYKSRLKLKMFHSSSWSGILVHKMSLTSKNVCSDLQMSRVVCKMLNIHIYCEIKCVMFALHENVMIKTAANQFPINQLIINWIFVSIHHVQFIKRLNWTYSCNLMFYFNKLLFTFSFFHSEYFYAVVMIFLLEKKLVLFQRKFREVKVITLLSAYKKLCLYNCRSKKKSIIWVWFI